METDNISAMKAKTIIITAILLILAGAGAWGYFHYQQTVENRPKQYETTEVTRGTIERIIVSTGTLDPVGSVEVGTQVSGTVNRVLVDFNDTVKAGQIIAEIDKSLLLSKLTETQASLSRAEALLIQSEQEFKRSEVLFGKGLISEQEFVRYRTDYHSQKASHQVAKAAVNTASENVRYATIRSPVKGTVIRRSVDVGQTVAASLSAPTLFVIAEDLKKMKIKAQVDETDIGRIRTDQSVRFSVQAYPERSFTGRVSQVRLQPEIVQNVVTYTVVILADNNDGTLLPGMTANVEFVEAREENVLVVPMSVFRFQPPEEVVKKFAVGATVPGRPPSPGGDGVDGADGADGDQMTKADRRQSSSGENDGGTRRRDGGGQGGQMKSADGRQSASNGNEGTMRRRDGGQGGQMKSADGRQSASGGNDGGMRRRDGGQGGSGGQGGGQRRASAAPGGRGVLWTLDENNEFKPIYVRIGLNDGVRAAVTGRGDDLREGLKVVTGEVRQEKKKTNQPNRSLIPQQQQGGNRGTRRM